MENFKEPIRSDREKTTSDIMHEKADAMKQLEKVELINQYEQALLRSAESSSLNDADKEDASQNIWLLRAEVMRRLGS